MHWPLLSKRPGNRNPVPAKAPLYRTGYLEWGLFVSSLYNLLGRNHFNGLNFYLHGSVSWFFLSSLILVIPILILIHNLAWFFLVIKESLESFDYCYQRIFCPIRLLSSISKTSWNWRTEMSIFLQPRTSLWKIKMKLREIKSSSFLSSYRTQNESNF